MKVTVDSRKRPRSRGRALGPSQRLIGLDMHEQGMMEPFPGAAAAKRLGIENEAEWRLYTWQRSFEWLGWMSNWDIENRGDRIPGEAQEQTEMQLWPQFQKEFDAKWRKERGIPNLD